VHLLTCLPYLACSTLPTLHYVHLRDDHDTIALWVGLLVHMDMGALYCTVLYCTVLYCTVLYCTVLYSAGRVETVTVEKGHADPGATENAHLF
jgi:hypothetical protein